jgi:hypothetical protein
MTDSDEGKSPHDGHAMATPPGPDDPVVNLARIRRIDTYEVMEQDLERLDEAFGRELQALAFMTSCGGVFVTGILSASVAKSPSELVAVLHTVVVVLFGIATAWFCVTWLRERAARPAIIKKIKETSVKATVSQTTTLRQQQSGHANRN